MTFMHGVFGRDRVSHSLTYGCATQMRNWLTRTSPLSEYIVSVKMRMHYSNIGKNSEVETCCSLLTGPNYKVTEQYIIIGVISLPTLCVMHDWPARKQSVLAGGRSMTGSVFPVINVPPIFLCFVF